jgi:hypothetical protein
MNKGGLGKGISEATGFPAENKLFRNNASVISACLMV